MWRRSQYGIYHNDYFESFFFCKCQVLSWSIYWVPLLRLCPNMSPVAASLMKELLTLPAWAAVVLSELLVMLPFLAVVSISVMQSEPNVCQPEWGNGPSALCWALISSSVVASKRMPEQGVRNGHLLRGYGRGTSVGLIIANNVEWGPKHANQLVPEAAVSMQVQTDGTGQEAWYTLFLTQWCCFVVVWPWTNHFTFMLCHSKVSSVSCRL